MRFLVRSWDTAAPGCGWACAWPAASSTSSSASSLLASVRWLGPLAWLAALPLAGAALIFWTVYRLQQDSIRAGA